MTMRRKEKKEKVTFRSAPQITRYYLDHRGQGGEKEGGEMVLIELRQVIGTPVECLWQRKKGGRRWKVSSSAIGDSF